MNKGHEIAMALRAAYLALHRRTNAAVSGRDGVTSDQFVALSLLAETDGVTQQSLARRMSSDPATTGAMLVLLEKRGLIERPRHPADGRARCVVLTREGRQTIARLRSSTGKIRNELQDLLSAREAASLLRSLTRIALGLSGEPAALPHDSRRRDRAKR